jgi:hypothetical protein
MDGKREFEKEEVKELEVDCIWIANSYSQIAAKLSAFSRA